MLSKHSQQILNQKKKRLPVESFLTLPPFNPPWNTALSVKTNN